MPFEDDKFECVIDKGLLDSVLSGDYSAQNSKKVINHVHRILNKKTGVYIIVSHGFPENRRPYLFREEYNWNFIYHKIYKPDVVTGSLEFDASDNNNYYFVYVCKMGVKLNLTAERTLRRQDYWALTPISIRIYIYPQMKVSSPPGLSPDPNPNCPP